MKTEIPVFVARAMAMRCSAALMALIVRNCRDAAVSPNHASFVALIIRFTPRLANRSEEHTSELQSRLHLVCRLLLEKKKKRDESIAWLEQERVVRRVRSVPRP